VKLLYMNQGGGGNWGAIAYGDFHVLCLAECSVEKQGFTSVYKSRTMPQMIVQVRDDEESHVRDIDDVDKACGSVRPIVRLRLTSDNVIVVFVHLKSGNEGRANSELEIAASAIKKHIDNNVRRSDQPVLWVGDFNRAEFEVVNSLFSSASPILRGGGQAKWNLDWVFVTGKWDPAPTAEIATRSGDHGHIGIRVNVERQKLQ
jgi:hypothetical protein